MYKDQRLYFAKKYIKFGNNYKNVIFLDKKKFNIDGFDKNNYFRDSLILRFLFQILIDSVVTQV